MAQTKCGWQIPEDLRAPQTQKTLALIQIGLVQDALIEPANSQELKHRLLLP